jgi:dipeptidyl aminopeptidase B
MMVQIIHEHHIAVVDNVKSFLIGRGYRYMSAKVLESNTTYVSSAVSVAPVSDWRYYDSMFTERYMKLPADNEVGYDKSAVTNMAPFQAKPFLLIHGSADDNVHFQNSAHLVWKLTNAHVHKYRVQFFTDSDHSMSAGGIFSLSKC